jgi:hypothetical protein
MLVEQLIRQLEQYPHDEELYVEYWDKGTVEVMEDTELTDDEWGQVVYTMEEDEGSSYFPTALRFNQTIEELTNAKLIERK